MACRYITTLESHSSEGGVQTSLYLKITASLWFTTAMLTSIITPFVDSLDNKSKSLVPAMYAIFLTEMLKAPVTQLADIPGQINRHFFAPRATNQKQMNSFFQGSSYQLSERYTVSTIARRHKLQHRNLQLLKTETNSKFFRSDWSRTCPTFCF
jgi:hypothetical protein